MLRYDNEYTSMLSQLRVYGPAFKKHPIIDEMNYSMVTEVYNLFCTLLGKLLSVLINCY